MSKEEEKVADKSHHLTAHCHQHADEELNVLDRREKTLVENEELVVVVEEDNSGNSKVDQTNTVNETGSLIEVKSQHVLKKKSHSTSNLLKQSSGDKIEHPLKTDLEGRLYDEKIAALKKDISRRRHFSCSAKQGRDVNQMQTKGNSDSSSPPHSNSEDTNTALPSPTEDDQRDDRSLSSKKRNIESDLVPQLPLVEVHAVITDLKEGEGEEEGRRGSSESNETTARLDSLLDLAWEDILFVYILPLLNWKDLFNLRSTSTQAKALITSYFSKLKTLEVARAVNHPFSNVSFKVVTESCTNLRKLVIVDCDWIEDKSLTKIFKSNKLLNHIDLSGCVKLNGSCLLSLSVNCKSLTSLILRDCTWISRGALETLMAHLRRLQVVDFTSCAALNNQQISLFTKTFPQLTRLHLARIQSVNDSTLSIVARNCKNLNFLDIKSCMGVTDNGIRMLAEYCTKLTALHVVNCHLVTEYSLGILRSRGTVLIDRPCAFVMPMPMLLAFPRVQV